MTALPKDKPARVAIIVVTYNADDFVRICLDSIARYSTMNYELIVVDNNSEDSLRDYLRQRSDIDKLILNEENHLWCEGCNIGMRQISDDVTHVLLFNSDMEVRRADWLQQMVNLADYSNKIGIVGTAKNCVRIWPTFGSADGQCLMIKRGLLDEIGLMNSEKFPWNGGDIDLAARAFKKGYIYKIMPCDLQLVVHYHGMSRRTQTTKTAMKKLHQDIDIMEIVRQAGLKPIPIPRFFWNFYTRLPGRPFYEVTNEEKKIARGRKKPARKFFGQSIYE